MLFHIIYTRGTVQLLLFLAESLLQWSDCRLHLVANGCAETELTLLRQFAAREPRVSWEALPTERIMMHGDALNYLQKRCLADHFCFLDSDIYAKGPFTETFTPLLNHCAALFSGASVDDPSVGCRFEPDGKIMLGRFSHTSDGLCLGSTYFAIYNNRRLNALRQSTGLNFKKYRWSEIPGVYQAQLEDAGLRCEIYEPGKLLNLLLQWSGERICYLSGPHLRHLGGVSRFASLSGLALDVRLKIRVKLMLQGEFRSLIRWSFTKTVPYFAAVLNALQQGRPLPAPPSTTDEARAELMRQVARELAELHVHAGGKFA